ncbi:MAG: alpha-ketoacid dehydrogenase subunit beta [Clostridia bacterium]|nr:alpha-ketoacid dehydrogenase subunit beta [Clostridia bacterium]
MKTTMTFGAATREAIIKCMREDKSVIIFGEDVGVTGGTYGVSRGLQEEFGFLRVRDTPVSESGFCGAAVGAAATGLRPIAELMMIDFIGVAMDQIFNQAAKMRYMFGGKLSLPIVFRAASGGGTSSAAQHSQTLEAWLTHVPGLKVIAPSNPQDAYGMMITAIRDNDPVFVMEHKLLYSKQGEVNLDAPPVPLGKGRVAREGGDVSIITYSKQVTDALDAAKTLAAEGISAEVIDLRSLFPLDFDLITESIKKTGRAVVFTEENKRGGYGGEISAQIGEELFDWLDAPVVRIGALNTPVPYSPVLEKYYLPCAADIVSAVKKMM